MSYLILFRSYRTTLEYVDSYSFFHDDYTSTNLTRAPDGIYKGT